MPLDLLSSIKGASSSEAVAELFNVIKKAVPENKADDMQQIDPENIVSLENLRSDEVKESSEMEKEIIRANFPKEKNGYLVVPKVIDD